MLVLSMTLSQNGGKFDFVIEGTLGLPVPGNGFWDFLLSQAKSQWGLMVYEQDWLDYVGSYLPATYVSTSYLCEH